MKDRPGVILVAAALLCFALFAVGGPVVWAGASALRETNLFAPLKTDPGQIVSNTPSETFELHFFSWSLTLQTIATALGIGLCSTVLGWPLAWLLRMRGWRFLPLVATPLLLPNYLAFGAYNLLRAPGTILGDWLERAARGDSGWIPVFAGKALAAASLSLWAAPLAGITLSIWLARIETSTLEQLTLDSPGKAKWFLERVRLGAPGILAAITIVTLLMLGSVIPLHVARLETLTIRVWLAMDLLPQDRQWRAWITAWPMLLFALIGAWLFWRLSWRDRPDVELRTDVRPESVRGHSLLGAIGIFALGALVPLGLFAVHLASAGGLLGFVRIYADQLINSAEIATSTGVAAVLLMLAAWIGMLSGPFSRRLVRLSLFVFAFGALAPGIMIGVWLAAFVRRVYPALEDSAAILAIAHLVRFGIVPIALGCWLASGEAREQTDQRRLDGATGVLGLLKAAIAGNWAALGAGGAIVAILSFHEIECSIELQPPGVDTFARAILNQLHFARTQELSAAGLILLGVGLVIGGVTLWFLSRSARFSRPNPPS
ncbi:MAG: hypothetical protein KF691_14460 [Phycisphaeraceae bacterium]|nr:hypothetical protein [Phycisphaeraceae bacterium]